MAGRGFLRRLGGHQSMLGNEVGIGCDREVIRRLPILMGGVSLDDKIK